jgi:tripartite-type tricarboxylate transporter receptor subunit TctC
VKGGVTSVWIKTALPENPDKQIIIEIEAAIQTYLASKEIKDTIKSDHYMIQLVNKEKTNLLQVSNSTGE